MTNIPAPVPVVIDTSSLIANLRQPTADQLNLPKLWQQNAIKPFATPETLRELRLELLKQSASTDHYQATKFTDRTLRLYEPYCRLIIERLPSALPECRDPNDQIFINLAVHSKAAYLITRDRDLLILNGQTTFPIITDTSFIAILSQLTSHQPD